MSVGKFGENTGGKTISHPLLTACSRRKKSEKEIFMLNTCHNNGYADNYPCYMVACTASCKQHRSIALG